MEFQPRSLATDQRAFFASLVWKRGLDGLSVRKDGILRVGYAYTIPVEYTHISTLAAILDSG